MNQAEFEQMFAPLHIPPKEPLFREVTFVGRNYGSSEHIVSVTGYMFDISLIMSVLQVLRSRKCDYITIEPYVLGDEDMPY